MTAERAAAGLDEIRELLAALDLRDDAFAERRERLIEEAAALRYAALRLARPELPTIDLLFGPSGSGKSTLFNALAGGDHALTSSVERPTTKGALAGATPATLDALEAIAVFPTFDVRRARGSGSQQGSEGRVSLVEIAGAFDAPTLLVDSPDYDTKLDANRRIAERLLRWADRVIFVVALERYADRSAAPHLAEIARLGIPAIHVLNKAESGDDEAARASFAERLAELGAAPAPAIVVLPRVAGGRVADAPAVAELRAFLRTPPVDDRWRRRYFVFAEDLRRTVCTPIAEHGERSRRLVEALKRHGHAESGFDPDPQLARLQSFEEEARFWLRYSPRKVFRDAWRILRRPRVLFEAVAPPREPDESAIAETLTSQAWSVFEHVQTVARETLKRDPLGRATLAAPGFAEAELDRRRIQEAFRPLIVHLTEFASATVKRFRAEWEGRERSFVARAQSWAVHTVLKIVFLCLHAAVVPALLHEVLRFLGYRSFASEVEEEVERSRERFRVHLAHAIDDQMESYGRLIASLGPDVRIGERLERALAAAEEELA